MRINVYYEAPTDKVFEEVKEKCIEIWKTYDNEFGYVDERLKRIEPMENIQDNVMYMVAMFDVHNQQKLANLLSDEAKEAILERMIDGGATQETIPFRKEVEDELT